MERKIQYLRIDEAANELGVSTYTVRRWISKGRIKALRAGRGNGTRYRVYSDSVSEYKRNHLPFLTTDARNS